MSRHSPEIVTGYSNSEKARLLLVLAGVNAAIALLTWFAPVNPDEPWHALIPAGLILSIDIGLVFAFTDDLGAISGFFSPVLMGGILGPVPLADAIGRAYLGLWFTVAVACNVAVICLLALCYNRRAARQLSVVQIAGQQPLLRTSIG